MVSISVQQNVSLPEGYTARPATMDDAEICVGLFNACEQAQFGEQTARTDKLLGEWERSGFDLSTSTLLVFAPDNTLVGCIEVNDDDEVPVQPFVWARVHPQYLNKGVGTYIMRWAAKRARQAIERVPDDARVVIQTACQLGHKPSEQLFENEGMSLVRHFWTMRIDALHAAPAPQIPDGFEFRPMRYPEEFEKVVRATDDAFKDHWGHVDQSDEASLKEWTDWVENEPDFDPTVWFLAIDKATDEIAGMSLCLKKARNNSEMGAVDSLGVRRAWRRKGLALAILQYSFHELHKVGNNSVILGVDASSLTGATRLYEKAGMHVERQTSVYERELRPGKTLSTTTAGE
ncbi:MAG: GNAT family N-acetyltransferase [Aggregatilineales bacterium]